MKDTVVKLLIVLVIGYVVFTPSARSQTNANQKTGKGTVSGRVTLHGKGVAGIGVVLRSAESDQQSRAVGTTDSEGNYKISRVPPGQYHVIPVGRTFVTVDIDTSIREGKFVVLAENDNVTGIDFTVVKGGVITGRVTDEDGKPVVEEPLSLIQLDSNQSVRSQSRNSRTDDRGVYRIFGLRPGHYKVAAGQDERMGPMGRVRRPYKMTYHPDAADPAKATIIEVLEGSENSGIDITVGRLMEGYSASGQIIDGETGKPLANIRIGVARIESKYGYRPVNPVSTARGGFRIEGLAPGHYNVVINNFEDNSPFAAPVPFEIVDRDVENLIIKTSRGGASLTGVVLLEGSNDKTLLARLYQLRLNILVQGSSPGFPNWRSTAINPDGSFRLTGLQPGLANVNTLSAANYQPVKDFVVLHMEREGVRVTQGVELRENEETSGLRVFVAHGTGVIRGEFTFLNGTMTPGSRLMVMLTRVGERLSLRSADVDTRGRFAIEGVPAGAYLLQINGHIPGARNLSVKQQVNVVDGVVTEVTIPLDLNPTPGSKP